MKHVGIICEYNPFHGGHAHLLRSVREAQTVICLMSGNFTQRGEAAILPPRSRAAMALAAGADLVLELPFPYAAGSARYFASAGVRALQALGADTLAFGSENRRLRIEGTALKSRERLWGAEQSIMLRLELLLIELVRENSPTLSII